MTCCTTLLADYFHGSQREKYFGLQVVFTTVAATIFFGVGGALGAQNWRTPFWLYAVSLPLAVAAARFVWQPAPRAQAAARTEKLAPLPWRTLRTPVLVTLLGGLVFYVLIVELSFKLDDIGVKSDGDHRPGQRDRLSRHGGRRIPLRPAGQARPRAHGAARLRPLGRRPGRHGPGVHRSRWSSSSRSSPGSATA